MLKLFVSFVIFRIKVIKDPSIRRSFTFKEIMLWSVPAILYAVGHNMYYSIMQMVDTPVTIQVVLCNFIWLLGFWFTWNCYCWYLFCCHYEKEVIFKFYIYTRVSGIHWAAMILICDSVASIQLARSPTQSFVDFPIYPAFLTIISTAIVACAGVFIEKLMKSHKDMSIFQQNVWLYLYSIILLFIP